MKKYIPNIITLGNLFCGTLATIYAIQQNFVATAFLVVLGIFFDFFDGLAARLLNVQGELGKELDSLADMVTSGVVPGIVMLQLLNNAFNTNAVGYFGVEENHEIVTSYFSYLGILLTLFAGYRLASFNVDERQSDSFIGLPTPAMSLFVVSLPLIIEFSSYTFFIDLVLNKYFLIVITILLSIVMNAELPLFALKFKNFSFKKNALQYVFLIVSLLCLVIFQFVAIPLIIFIYVIMSIVNNSIKKAN